MTGVYMFILCLCVTGMAATINVHGTASVGMIKFPATHLLNEITAVAEGAYSVGRALTNSWTSALALVIRSSDSATNYLVPQGATNNISAILTWAGADSVYVTNLFDQSGHGRTLAGTNILTMPKIVTNGVHVSKSGRTAMHCDATDGSKYDNLTATVTLSLPVTYVMNVYPVNASSTAIIVSGGTGASTTNAAVKFGLTTYKLNNGTNVNIGVQTASQWDILRVVFDGVSSIGVDGNTPVTGAAGVNTVTAFNIGAGDPDEAVTANMLLSEWVVFNAALSETDQRRLRDNMNAFYGVF